MTWGELAWAERWTGEAETQFSRQRQHIERQAVLGQQNTSETELQRRLMEQFLAIARA